MGRVSNALEPAGFQKPTNRPAISGIIITGEVVANMAFEDGLRHRKRYTKDMIQQRTRDAYPNDPEQADTIADFLYECYSIGYEEGSCQ